MEVSGQFHTLAILLQTEDTGSPWIGGRMGAIADLDTKEKR
jgi:hypothetical protein